MTQALTPKETALLEAITEGMDAPGSGWLHELAPCDWSPRSAAGVLSALIKKELVVSTKMEATPGYTAAYWVELT